MKQTSREERPQIEIKRNAKLSTEGMKRVLESEKDKIQMSIYTICTIYYILYIKESFDGEPSEHCKEKL